LPLTHASRPATFRPVTDENTGDSRMEIVKLTTATTLALLLGSAAVMAQANSPVGKNRAGGAWGVARQGPPWS